VEEGENADKLPSSSAAATTQDSDSKTLSSEESSEEEEEESEEAGKETEATSILPSSVLSRAGAIAQHFGASVRRPSLASSSDDAACSPGCLSPARLLLNRTGGALSPGSDGPEVFRPANANLLSPRDTDDMGMTGGGGRQRRDSTLSRHDRLLIGKIKSYYEVAESQDPAFCLRRRESLTSIPTGLVRSSVSHFNCAPPPPPAGEGVRMKPLPSDADDDDDRAPGGPDSGDQWGGAAVGEDPALRSAVIVGGSVGYSSALAAAPALQDEQEEFRSSSEMIQIWQAMEQNLGRTARRRVRETPDVQPARTSRMAASGRTGGGGGLAPKHDPGVSSENGGSDLGTVTEDSASGLSVKRRTRTAGPAGRAGSPQETLKRWGGEAPVHRPPRVLLELRGRAPPQGQEQDSRDDPDGAKSKVLSLARQYSQRIKTSKPDPRLGKRTLTCVLEESESSGTCQGLHTWYITVNPLIMAGAFIY